MTYLGARDRAFLKDLHNSAVLNRVVASLALLEAYKSPEAVAVEVHATVDGLDRPSAEKRANDLRTTARVQTIVVARLVGEVASVLEDCGGLCIAIRDRPKGMMRRYLKSSAAEVDLFFDDLLGTSPPDVAALLGLPPASAAGSATAELGEMYRAIDDSLPGIAGAYRGAGDSVLWDPAAEVAPDLSDQIKVVLDEEEWPVEPTVAGGAERGLLAQVLNKLKHRFVVVEDLEAIGAGRGGIRFAHYRRDPAGVRQLVLAVKNVTRTMDGLIQLVLYLDELDLLAPTPSR
jgi:hypothetical protein